MGHLLDHALGGLDHLGLQPVGGGKDFQPFGNMEINLRHRKLLQNAFQNMENIVLLQLLTVHRQHGHLVGFRHLPGQLRRLIGVRFDGV